MKRSLEIVIGAILVAAIVGNGATFFHARAMVRFSESGVTTKKPDELGLLGKARVLFTGVTVKRPVNRRTPADESLVFETHRIATRGDAELEAWSVPIENPRAVVLLFHGYADSKEALLPVARELHALRCHSLLVDFYGSGGSSGSSTSIGWNEAADVVASIEFVRKLRPGVPVLAYGMSMGGAAILRSSTMSNEFADAVVIESTFDTLLNAVRNRFTSLGLPSTALAEFIVLWGGVYSGFNGFRHNPYEYAASLDCPALVMNGSEDPRVSLEQARRIYDELGGWKRFVEFSSNEHAPLVTKDRERWVAEVATLLARLEEEG